MPREDSVFLQDVLETTDRRRVKLSKIGAAILQHIQKYDDVQIIPAAQVQDKNIAQRSDL
jgi:transcriptional regulator NrdR family protein